MQRLLLALALAAIVLGPATGHAAPALRGGAARLRQPDFTWNIPEQDDLTRRAGTYRNLLNGSCASTGVYP